jgi:hypothetical protein
VLIQKKLNQEQDRDLEVDQGLEKDKTVNAEDAKLYVINLSALGVSMVNVETVLKVLLLVISIGYTLQRWYYLYKNKA